MLSPAAIPVIAIGIFLAPIVRQVYLYFSDPKGLRKFSPLTPLSDFTALAYIWHILGLDTFRSRSLSEDHKTRDVIRLTPDHLSFRTTGAIKDIYGHGTTCIKGDVYTLLAGEHYHILNIPDKAGHSIKRKRLSAAFATKNLLAWEYKIVDKVERLVAGLDKLCSQPNLSAKYDKSLVATGKSVFVDLRKWTNYFTVDAIADIALSQRLGLLDNGNDQVPAETERGVRYETGFINAVHAIGRAAIPLAFSATAFPWLKRFTTLFSTEIRNQWSGVGRFEDVIRFLVNERMGRQSKEKGLDDFMSCLLEDGEGEALNLDIGEISSEVAILMDAGSDTTAIALTHILWQLSRHPVELQKLRDEIKPVFDELPEGSFVASYNSLRNCAYLRACLDESLRLHPPISTGLQRKTTGSGTKIDGHFIPGDVLVSVPAYVAHRNEEVFPEPESFIPERWLQPENASQFQKNFLAFSAGSRGCVGRNITYLEQIILIATFVQRYDFVLPEKGWHMEWEERFNLWPKDLPMKLSRRST